jgi:hypothetical protein
VGYVSKKPSCQSFGHHLVWGALKVPNELPMGLLEKGLDVA